MNINFPAACVIINWQKLTLHLSETMIITGKSKRPAKKKNLKEKAEK